MTKPNGAANRTSNPVRMKDNAGIEWEQEILDHTTGHYRRTRITPLSRSSQMSLKSPLVREGHDIGFISEIPADQGHVLYMVNWLMWSRLHFGTHEQAYEKLNTQFLNASSEDCEMAARIHVR